MNPTMRMPAPLETLFQAVPAGDEEALPLPPTLAAWYGELSVPAQSDAPYVIGNFVTTLDGVVALEEPGHGGGGEISGFNIQDRVVMGLLRAVADAVVVGAGTLRADPQHHWTAEFIFPPLADAYHTLRSTYGTSDPPLNVIVTARGELDVSLPVFQSGKVRVLIVTTPHGAACLATEHLPPSVMVVAVESDEVITARMVIEAISRVRKSRLILVEGGPHLMGDFLAERRLDELFLTLAPQVAGRDDTQTRPGFVAGKRLAPDNAIWGRLRSVKRSEDHLFLRYALSTAAQENANEASSG